MTLLLLSRRSYCWIAPRGAPILRMLQSVRCNNDSVIFAASEVDGIYNEIIKANGGEAFNVNSPKQVSQAIFGSHQSTSRKSLIEAASSCNLEPQKRALATLVLRFRDVQSTMSKRSLSTGAAATMAYDDEVESNILEKKVMDDMTMPLSRAPVPEASFDQTVAELFGRKSKVHPYWKNQLLRLTKPSVRSMVSQLNGDICAMGYDPLAAPNDHLRGAVETTTTTAGKAGSLLAFVRDEKQRFQECVMLIRVGEFYESYGIDALMLMEHCGLNAMAGKCRAGCPVRNVQATLDSLTIQGLKVAVYEEAADTNASHGPSPKSKLKNRMLGQIVSSASPCYLYDLVLGNTDTLASLPESRPYVGIIANAAGYTMVEVTMDDRSVIVSERLTPEAVSCRLTAYPPVDPLLYVGDDQMRSLPFLSSSTSSRVRVKIIPSSLVENPSPGVSDAERVKRIVLRALLGMVEDGKACKLTEHDFTLVSSSTENLGDAVQAYPLHSETATQLGLMGDRCIPPMVRHLIPDSAPAACRRFLRRWLLAPPPSTVSNAMANLVVDLRERGQALPPLPVPPVGKVVALLRAGQASAPVFGEVLSVLDSTLKIMHSDIWTEPMMTLLEYESGIAAIPESITNRCSEAVSVIEDVISPWHHVKNSKARNDRITDFSGLIPRAFFDRNEGEWRGRIRPEVYEDAYRRVETSALKLARVVARDFWGVFEADLDRIIQVTQSLRNPIVNDIFNNQLAIREVPSHGMTENYFHPRDRNGKVLRNRYTTAAAQAALSDYVAASEGACQEVSSALTDLSEKLCNEGHLPAIVQSAHFNLIMATASQHAAQANILGWSMAKTFQRNSKEGDLAGRFSSVWPYWMDRSSAISNTFDLHGMFLLTAPNMSGKSTLMRATAAASLLSICGLCAPLESDSVIRRFDYIFVRGASSDVPSENLSAFGAEVLDISALLRCGSSDSLVFVDELGRGTSPRDGTSIAAAVVESMAQKGMSGIFATHLHEIFDLPLSYADRVKNKRMALATGEDGNDLSTFQLEDGICTDSLAMETAARFGFPAAVLERAQVFSSMLGAQESTSKIRQEPRVSSTTSASGVRTLEDAICALSSINGCEGTPVVIPAQWNPPPSLEGTSCVYILALEEDSTRFYVGETDSLSQRLRQHRAKGGAWSKFVAAVYHIREGKSQSRKVESLVIRALATGGFDMVSIVDGRSVRRRASKP